MSQQTINQILNDIYKTNRLMDDIKEAATKPEKDFQQMRLSTHTIGMEELSEVFDQTNRWDGYFEGLHPMTVEVKYSGIRDKQNR